MASPRLWISCGAALLFVLMAALWPLENRQMAARAERLRRQTVETGAALYEQHCRSCHGARGEGVGQLGPALADRHFFTDRLREVGWLTGLDEYVSATTGSGRMMATRPLYAGDGRTSVMPPWHQDHGGPLRTDEIAAISAFVMGWQATALGKVALKEIVMPPPDLSDMKTIQAGATVFSEHCDSCHQLDPQGSRKAGPSLAAIGLDAGNRVPGLSAVDYLRQSVLIPAAHIADAPAEQDGQRQDCGAILSEEQLQTVVAFLLQQQDRPAGQ